MWSRAFPVLPVLFLLTALPVRGAGPDLCGKFEIRTESVAGSGISRSEACTDSLRRRLVSKGCRKEEHCALLSDLGKKLGGEVDLEKGSTLQPGSFSCRALGGTPQVVEFKHEGEWWRLARCLGSDGEFMDLVTLLERTKPEKLWRRQI